MSEFNPTNHPHRRLNPLTNEYVLVSPHRMKRPWQGQQEAAEEKDRPTFDPSCYLCPGNVRASGITTEDYEETYTFENDFAAVLPPPIPAPPSASHPLLSTEPIGGGCDVLIFSRRHDLTLSRLTLSNVEKILEQWIRIYKRRGAEEHINYVQIFENKGAAMGCSNPHPHGQIWSTSHIPTLPATELAALRRYAETEAASSNAPKGPKGKPCILCEYTHVEAATPDRVVNKNDHWIAVVPWWAIWPYEILLLPYKRHIPDITQLTADEKVAFCDILSKVMKRYDNLFRCSCPYSMGIHQRPVPAPEGEGRKAYDEDEENVAHLHLHFTPPLLRSASVKKFLVGFELMAEAQRDLTPEQAAAKLRDCSEVHYLDDAKSA